MLKKVNTFFSTFHFILIFVGYQVATTLFLPFSSDIEKISRSVTIPYRGFVLVITLIVIVLNIKNKVKFSRGTKILIFYWIILIIRIFYDFYMRIDVYVASDHKFYIWMYVFPIVLLPTYATLKSYNHINLDKSLIVILTLTALSLILNYLSNPELQGEANKRMQTNVGLGSISTGHFALTGILLSLYSLFQKKTILKFVLIALNLIFGVFFLLKSGSRGPLLTFGVILIVWFFIVIKKEKSYIFLFSILIGIIFSLKNKILMFVGKIAPIIIIRFQREDQLDSRNHLFDEAINFILRKPFVWKTVCYFFWKRADNLFSQSRIRCFDGDGNYRRSGYYLYFIYSFEICL